MYYPVVAGRIKAIFTLASAGNYISHQMSAGKIDPKDATDTIKVLSDALKRVSTH